MLQRHRGCSRHSFAPHTDTDMHAGTAGEEGETSCRLTADAYKLRAHTQYARFVRQASAVSRQQTAWVCLGCILCIDPTLFNNRPYRSCGWCTEPASTHASNGQTTQVASLVAGGTKQMTCVVVMHRHGMECRTAAKSFTQRPTRATTC